MSSAYDDELNNHDAPSSGPEVNGSEPVGIDAMEEPTPIAKFGSMAEAGYFIQELEYHLDIEATIFEDQAFDPMIGGFKNFAQIIVPKADAKAAVEFLKEVFKKDEEDAEVLEELFGKEDSEFGINPYSAESPETTDTQHPLMLGILILATIGLLAGMLLR